MRASRWMGHTAGGGIASLPFVAVMLAGLGYGSASAAVPPGADELASHGVWSVFQYPLDPRRKCYIGSEPVRSAGATWLMLDVAAGELTLVRNPGEGYRRSGSDDVPQGVVSVGSQSFRYLLAPFSHWKEQDRPSDARVVEFMKTAKAAKPEAEMEVRGESWRGGQVTDAFSLRGFAAAHEAANGGACKARQPPAGQRGAIELSYIDVEPTEKASGDWYTEVRLLGPFFARGQQEALVIRAIPRDKGDRFHGLSFVNGQLDFSRDGSLIGREVFYLYTNLADVCMSPETGRLEIIVTSTPGGSAGLIHSYFLFYDPSTGRVMSRVRGTHGEEVYEEIKRVESGSFVPRWCPFRSYRYRMEEFSQEIMKESFFGMVGERLETVDELEKLARANFLGRHLRTPDGRSVEFADDIFSSYLSLIEQSGPDSLLRSARFDTSEYSVVVLEHSGYSYRDAFQMIFVKAATGDLWTPVYHAGPGNSLKRYKLAEVYGFVDEETQRIRLCTRKCLPWGWGEYAEVSFNFRTFESAFVPERK